MAGPWRAVLFDLDGVLVDSYDAWFHTLNAVARELDYPSIPPEAFAEGWGQGTEADQRRFYWNHAVEEVQRRLDEAFPEHLEHLRFDPDARDVVRAIRARGLPTALVTNTSAPMARRILARGGLALDAVVGGTDVPRPKPAPDMVLRACRDVGVEAAEALLVGDTAFDREAAAAAGVPFVGLRFGADLRLERLAELPGLLSAAGAR